MSLVKGHRNFEGKTAEVTLCRVLEPDWDEEEIHATVEAATGDWIYIG